MGPNGNGDLSPLWAVDIMFHVKHVRLNVVYEGADTLNLWGCKWKL